MAERKGSFVRSVSRAPTTFKQYPVLASDEAEAIATWLKALTVEPVSAVEWFCPEGWAIRERTVADDMAFCVVSGRYAGCVRTLADERPMVPGDILLIPRGVAHWIRRAEGDCYMVSFHMHTRAYGAIDALSLLQLGGVHVSPDREFVLRTVTHLAHEYAVRPLGWRRSMRAGMEQIVLEVLRDGGYTRPGHESPHFSPEIVGVCPALEVIESRLHDPTLRVSDIAAVMHMSEPALRARFRAVFGTSPVTIIRRERVARACILLRSTGDPVARIAEQCGFSDVPFFYRAFKSVMRTTPACYRDGRSMP